ncbi:DUF1217 domain-containing protein [Rhodobacteraceae bacterium M382]|nr:DUF1217 domain-containing protein [Rhodobacteraceae bacterium M382]
MTLQPIIPAGGIQGWRFLQQTYDRQFSSFSKDPVLKRDAEYFAENIGAIQSAEDLVSDRRLLRVALGAFGLEDDINNRYFVQKILSDGTSAEDALANRLADERYKDFSDAFGFGPSSVPKTVNSTDMQNIVDRFREQSFEVAVGEQNNDMRLALNMQRSLKDLATGDMSEDAKWFTVMGNPPLRQVFETALGLPSATGQLDIDQQLGIFKDRAVANFGSSTFAQFSTDAGIEDVTIRFLARSQISQIGASVSSASTALILLQNSNF